MAPQLYWPPSEELQRALDNHHRWVESGGAEGIQLTDENAGWEFTGLRLDAACFAKANLSAAQFIRCSLVRTDFAEAILDSVLFKQCDLQFACFDRAQMPFSIISDDSEVHGATFMDADVRVTHIPRLRSTPCGLTDTHPK